MYSTLLVLNLVRQRRPFLPTRSPAIAPADACDVVPFLNRLRLLARLVLAISTLVAAFLILTCLALIHYFVTVDNLSHHPLLVLFSITCLLPLAYYSGFYIGRSFHWASKRQAAAHLAQFRGLPWAEVCRERPITHALKFLSFLNPADPRVRLLYRPLLAHPEKSVRLQVLAALAKNSGS